MTPRQNLEIGIVAHSSNEEKDEMVGIQKKIILISFVENVDNHLTLQELYGTWRW